MIPDIIFIACWVFVGCVTVVWTAALGYLDVEEPLDYVASAAIIAVWPLLWAFAICVLSISGLLVLGKKMGRLNHGGHR
jgi:hypothetical protein